MKVRKAMPKVFILVAMLLISGMASAQVVVKGNVYGGCELGKVQKSTTVTNSGNTSVTINGGTLEESVYGGGKGSEDVDTAGWVQGNATVTMTGGIVVHSVYGGGYCGSVGDFTSYSGYEYYYDNENHKIDSVRIPTACRPGTGVAKVVISGGNVGKYGTQYGSLMPSATDAWGSDDIGYIFAGSAGVADSITYPKAPALGVADSTYLEISGGLVTASVYGGCENGLVLRHTSVKIAGGQIGTGHYMDGSTHKWDAAYDEGKWTAAINAVKNDTIAAALGTGGSLENYFHECDRWNFVAPYEVYDYYYDSTCTIAIPGFNVDDDYLPEGSAGLGHNGHTFFGHVFGGGSGYYPIAPGVWRYRAGQVNGNTTVEITGGHILSNVYGGNEYTDIIGKSTVTMSGGTVGIPRTTAQINGCPVNGYLFGAGMGDPRTMFNTWTNVGTAELTIDGGVVFSSVFGGGEEGHVLGNTLVTIDETDGDNKPTLIGTYGYLEYEGNVFGAGRGFTRLALTAGTIGGNSRIEIKGGTMLGSIYGGGSMASVGTFFTDPEHPQYGQLQPGPNHGYTTINITGGTIGNDYEAVYHPDFNTLAQGGNVFGGSKGAFLKLDNTTVNPIWLNMGKVKHTSITINQDDTITNIKGNVYGGGEFGTVEESTSIGISAGTIWRDVYGGGHGSDSTTVTTGIAYTPLQHAGRVYGNTSISISDSAWIKKCVYGGGEIASVGTITGIEATSLTQSWPYKFSYADNTGETEINITGGRIGLTGKDYFGPWDASGNPVTSSGTAYANDGALKDACIDNGDIYGGSKGRVVAASHLHHMGNVKETTININIPALTENPTTPYNYKPTTGDAGITNASIGYATGLYPTWDEWTDLTNAKRSCITGAVYAGAEEGHVNEDTKVTLKKGLVGHAIYGGGKGKGKDKDSGNYILTAGKVYGNTEINIEDGYVVRSVFGGGNLASVGKGNYIGLGLTGDEPQVHGADSIAVATSGIATINITGGQLGMLPLQPASGNPDPSTVVKDNIPYGSVFGGGRGQVVTPVNNNISDDFFAFVNDTYIKVGADNSTSTTSPLILGSVYGGGQDGHVRRNTHVTVNGGEIGVEYISSSNAINTMGNDDLTSEHWTTRGNVYGGGSGISKKDGNYTVIAGSVHDSTNVTINGGLIHRNVHGGGSMSFVKGEAKVTVNSPIGVESNNFQDVRLYDYGGYVFGAGRGDLSVSLDTFAYTGSTKVNIGGNAWVPGDVYGGGAMGQVKENTKVIMTAGTVGTIGYDWKTTTTDHTKPLDTIKHTSGGMLFGGGKGDLSHREAALVKGNTDVTLSGGHVQFNVYGGGEEASVGLRDSVFVNPSATPKVLKDFAPHAGTGNTKVTIANGQVGPAPKFLSKHNSSTANDSINIPIGLSGVDGYVFGGGKGNGDDPIDMTRPFYVQYYEVADVNNAEVIVRMDNPLTAADSLSNRIWGSVFGGAEDGHVLGNAKVQYISGLMGTTGTTSYDGNIFGGGRNFSRKNYSAGRVRGNDTVTMCGGTIMGSIFGGGRLALTGCGVKGFDAVSGEGNNTIYSDLLDGDGHGNIYVKVNGGTIGNEKVIETFLTHSMGDVFGGGKGTMDGINVVNHPKASSLLLTGSKNTTVVISDTIINGNKVSPRILGSVFGGGEVANVGQHEWKMQSYTGSTETVGDIVLKEGTGKATVIVSGGTIGADTAKMRVRMAGVPGDGNYNLYYNDDRGHVFGGGEGLSGANPYSYDTINPYSGTGTAGILNNKSLLDLMATVGETHVTISDSAYVKGSVYGGSMSGHVLHDAKVTVSGGQIGAGYNPAGTGTELHKYKEKQFLNPVGYFTRHNTDSDIHSDSALFGCYRWDYVANNQQSFDPIKLKNDPVANKPTNGETWFGHVFGGGSGYYPYIGKKKTNPNVDSCIWNPDAGKVYGHTEVEITGGHILSNVYGGCQSTDVGNYVLNSTTQQLQNNSDVAQSGKAIVTISGGTVGVPETRSSIEAFPFTCNVYGGGQGNFSGQLKKLNNVDSTRVVIKEVSGTPKPVVYGMVFGGSQNGHVIDSTKVLVSGGVIGTTGLTGYDGGVFGGGQGTFHPNPGHYDTLYVHAGRVGGNTRVIMRGGTALGNLYGGGLVALTGVGVNGWFDEFTTGTTYDSEHHGSAKVELSGGSVGNYFNNGLNVLTFAQPSGNVYGGGRGKLDDYLQDDFARMANSAVKISGSPTVYGSVFGGGEMANVGYWLNYSGWYATNTASTSVSITGSPKIGTEKEFDGGGTGHYSNSPGNWTYYDTVHYVNYKVDPYDTTYIRMLTHTRTGNVYGGGQGEVLILGSGSSASVAGLEQGHCGSTYVNINMTDGDNGGHILGSVFGGSEEGMVWGNTEVHIAGGTIGWDNNILSDSLKMVNHVMTPLSNHATYSYGSVYGGSYGKDFYNSFNISNATQQVIESVNVLSGRVYGNTLVDITGGAVRGNVYGGGDMASVGYWKDSIINGVRFDIVPAAYPGVTGPHSGKILGNATVNVSQASGKTTIIGPLDGTGLNAYVFGGGKGFSNDPEGKRKAYVNVDSTFVTVSGGKIWGSVFGGGNDAHTLGSAKIEVHAGADIGKDGLSTWDGNIFGGGRDYLNTNHTNGRVRGNIDITMDGGTLQGSIFGGGRMALSGVNVNGEFPNDNTSWPVAKHGNVTITVSGGEIGNGTDQGIHLLTGSDESVGDIFGSGKGDTKQYDDTLAGRVTNTTITITDGTRIHGAVFGGGEMASIGWWGSDRIFYDKTGSATITIGRDGETSHPNIGTYLELDTTYLNDHYQVNGTGPKIPHSEWTMFDSVNGVRRITHTCTGNVFGGCQGDVDFKDWDPSNPDTWNNWPYMGRSRTSNITVNNGTIMSRVFGGSEQGSMDGDTHITINDGTIGREVTDSNEDKYYFGGVYGAGYGSDDETENTIPIYANGPTADTVAGRVYGNTQVDIYGGTINGDVYGGASYALVGDGVNVNKGKTQVNIGKEAQIGHPELGTTILGQIYGANNQSGTPYGSVRVDIWHTAHTPYPITGLGNHFPIPPAHDSIHTEEQLALLPHNPSNFALLAVYGASNHADYKPLEVRANNEATVWVHECSENTIYDVYGGSNAASVYANTNVVIEGGRMHRVFGGGNGEITPAHIFGIANTKIEGGLIDEVYGGSNNQGIIETTHLDIGEQGGCPLIIGSIYGGSNEAPIIGDVVTTVECGSGTYGTFYGGTSLANIYGNVTVNIMGGTFANLFAGSKGRVDNPATTANEAVSADIYKYPTLQTLITDSTNYAQNPTTYTLQYPQALLTFVRAYPELGGTGGNVTLNLYGGSIENAFGGSDSLGIIQGKIMVNVIDTVTDCDLNLTNLYGAGRHTVYEPDLVNGQIINSPEVNVIHGMVGGNVFGGGLGAHATTKANPVVNIGFNRIYNPTVMDSLKTVYKNATPSFDFDDAVVHVKGNVYGGGRMAQVLGNTRVNVVHGSVGDSTRLMSQVNPTQDSTYLNGLMKAYKLSGGHVYGGGQGDDAHDTLGYVSGNTFVNVFGDAKIYHSVYGGGMLGSVGSGNLSDKNSGVATVVISGGEIGPLDGTGLNAYVYGGGRGKDVDYTNHYKSFANVDSTSVIVCDSARIYGSIFGGGSDGHVLGDARVQLLGKTGTRDTIPVIGTNGMTSWDGNIFGGGRNYRHTNFAAGRVGGNIEVEMRDGLLLGNIYGGGRLALTGVNEDGAMQSGNAHGNTKIMVKGGTVGNVDEIETFSESSMGNIYGGGKGMLMAQAADTTLLLGLTKNTTIEISDTLGNNTHVYGIVLGGGEIANVGQYTLTQNPSTHAVTDIAVANNTGKTKVKISGGIIGGDRTQMRPDTYEPESPWLLYNDDLGYVYGGGEGWSDDPTAYVTVQDTSLVDLIATVQSTEVEITGTAWVKASVFGGSESGHVRKDTKVTISGGQIGAGYYVKNGVVVDSLYSETQFINPVTTPVTNLNSLSGTAHWPYGKTYSTIGEDTVLYKPFDPVLLSQDTVPSDGKSWFGNVFGGGSGWFPYVTGNSPSNYVSHWNPLSGKVWGNTEVNITGGHILNNVFGANESTDVGGKATVKMSGGTVGVPRTPAQVALQPVTSYVYGGGSGDPRAIFDGTTNVGSTDVQITGGIVYGSVFGGAEDGHVLGDVDITINQDDGTTVIGSTGRSSADGNIFGGGRNFMAWSSKSGRVEGNVTINMSGDAKMLGNIYGGGRLASVGMKEDGTMWGVDNDDHGNITVNVSGCRIGPNPTIDTLTSGSIFGGGMGRYDLSSTSGYGQANNTNVIISGSTTHVNANVFGGSAYGVVNGDTHVTITGGEIGESTIYQVEGQGGALVDSIIPGLGIAYRVLKGGDVYGGGRGYQPTSNYADYADRGIVKGNTFVNISGATHVYDGVFGGGEFGSVGTGDLADKTSGVTTVTISGGEIGPLDGTGRNANVYGGGQGMGGSNFVSFANVDSTSVIVCDSARIYGSIYGGSSDGHVLGDATVHIMKSLVANPTHDTIPYIGTNGRTGYDGNVFGGGENPDYSEITSGSVTGNIKTDISAGKVLGNVYGGGSYGLTGMIYHNYSLDTIPGFNHGYVTVNISGGTIGTKVDTITIGNVYGGGKGITVSPNNPSSLVGDAPAWGRVKNTQVNISGNATHIHGSVYGGGELAYTMKNTSIKVTGGVIGSELPREDDPTKTRYNGSVFGGGKGFFTDNDYLIFEKEPGIVYGDATISIEGGQVMENVYGGGEIGSVGNYYYDMMGFMSEPVSDGNTYVTVKGGQIGPLDGTGMNGNVYGGGKGLEDDTEGRYSFLADIINSHVKIDIPTSADISQNRVWGSVFGGGADGHIIGDANVEIKSGVVGTDDTGINNGNVYGGGKNTLSSNYSAGRVAGNTNIDMKGGTVKGSVFGGGREGITGLGVQGGMEYSNGNYVFTFTPFMIEDPDKGKTLVEISGGTVIHDVYGGGKGTTDTIKDNSGKILTLGENLGRVKNSEVNISGTAQINGNVYGGGEVASVGWYSNDTIKENGVVQYVHYLAEPNTGLAKVNISGGQVGVEQNGQAEVVGANVFGGGLGIVGGKAALPFANVDSTKVNISGTAYIVGSVFGGSDKGHVTRSTNINVSGGTVGKKNTLYELYTDRYEQARTHIYTGSVLAGGRGIDAMPDGTYNDTTGLVFGNANVTVDGTAVVRHAVYGGGGLSSVGTYIKDSEGAYTFIKGGKTYVNVGGTALVGPTKKDLTEVTSEELAATASLYGSALTSATQYADSAFKYLGGNAGWVFGAGCGLTGNAFSKLTYNDSTFVRVYGDAQVVGSVYGGGENGHVHGSTDVTVSGGTIGGVPLHGDSTGVATLVYPILSGHYSGVTVHLAKNDGELNEDEYGYGRHIFRGAVYGGGKGTDTVADPSTNYVFSPTAGRVFGNTNVTVSDSALIYNRVYGGGLIASVGNFHYYHDAFPNPAESGMTLIDSIQRIHYLDNRGITTVNIKGGTIGTDGRNNGDVVGGGRGMVGRPIDTINVTVDESDQVVHLAYVRTTNVNISEEKPKYPTRIKSNVYGGSINGSVHGDAHVTVTGGTIGTMRTDDPTKVHGGWHSNVYGGGGGSGRYKLANGQKHLSIVAGRVFGNTSVEISGGTVLHNVYGGGAIASVGTYDLRKAATNPIVPGTANTVVTITGDNTSQTTIGKDGNENGMVFGSGRGEIDAPGAYMDSLSYAANATVNIGTLGSTSVYPKVKGSVYGSGENGHVFLNAIVNVNSGTVGCESYEADHFAFRGNVYGAGCGTDKYNNNTLYNPIAGIVQGNTEVNIKGGHISHNVYGGGAMAMVGSYTFSGSNINTVSTGTGKAIVNVSGGTIGTSNAPSNVNHGDVYGGARGTASDEDGFTDKAIVDSAYVNISGGDVLGSVYGGGAKSLVHSSRVVNISGGTVHQDVYGGSNDSLKANTPFVTLKTVNVSGGTVNGNVFGCSHNAIEEGDSKYDFTSFVNITGGTIDHHVFAAGNGGEVNGSVCLNIGKTAVDSTQNNTGNRNVCYNRNGYGTYTLTPKKLIVRGNVYGGSHHFGTTETNQFNKYDIEGFSVVAIDGTGYDTRSTAETSTYMNIASGILGGSTASGVYGCGAHSESGKLGREIIIRNYGERNNNTNGQLLTATRDMTTIQRGGVVLLDGANINLSGAVDINQDLSNPTNTKKFGMLRIDNSLMIADSSSIVLGTFTPNIAPAFMDSIKQLASLQLKKGKGSCYSQMGSGHNSNWYVIGINNNDNKLYRIDTVGTNHIDGAALTYQQENVIIFNDTSKLWVRYRDNSGFQYGELLGFFRMLSPLSPYGTRTFAEARPKLTVANGCIASGGTPVNDFDGGFLSYDNANNFYAIDGGQPFTNTKQYPYTNVLQASRDGFVQYREWLIRTVLGNKWYVDGRTIGNFNVDYYGKDTKESGRGLYPDLPKQTITRNAGENQYGIYAGTKNLENADVAFSQKDDAIYVVGPVNASLEAASLNLYPDSIPLKLYRYPGAVEGNAEGQHNLSPSHTVNPSPNYGALVDIPENQSLTLNNVSLDGLNGYADFDSHGIAIPSGFDVKNDTMPMVVTHKNSTLSLNKGTVLTRGYNHTNAEMWYTNSDYTPYDASGNVSRYYHGAALFVDSLASVYVSDSVFIHQYNEQYLKIGNGPERVVESNVYLPTFSTKLYIANSLYPTTSIGITSPKRNKGRTYEQNTLSPVAYASNPAWSELAWTNCNFYDDQNWFFVKGHTSTSPRTTYRKSSGDINTLYFGWTWANVVRKQPTTGYAVSGDNINISTKEGLAWLISQSASMNDQTATDFSGKTIKQTADLDMVQYVWVPIGDDVTDCLPFAGTYDGQGHTIDSICIEAIGIGDRRYERNNYGLFGRVAADGTVTRTFLVGGKIQPAVKPSTSKDNLDESYLPEEEPLFEADTIMEMRDNMAVTGPYNIGGLVGYLDGGTVCNSEAAVSIECYEGSTGLDVVAGGLVGQVKSGEVHSSMAMPEVVVKTDSKGLAGGLVGSAKGGSIQNSFARSNFNVTDGGNANMSLSGLLGENDGGSMNNCYMALQPLPGSTSYPTFAGSHFGSIVGDNTSGTIDSCYSMNNGYIYTYTGHVATSCKHYSDTINSNSFGYMYSDNKVDQDTAMFLVLNRWADNHNRSEQKYARWARPALSEINSDLPVLMINNPVINNPADGVTAYQGDLRSLATISDKPYVLQYGGPVRDDNQLNGATGRMKANDALFVYGDITETLGKPVPKTKISVHEDVAILHAGDLADYDSTYVGITFENSFRDATSTPGLNNGLGVIGAGGYLTGRDWHMFSSPLKNAPLGFDYRGHNVNTYTSAYTNVNVDHSIDGHYNNPWVNPSKEFAWLDTLNFVGSDECSDADGHRRYWMKDGVDGYFPYNRGALFSDPTDSDKPLASQINNLFVVNSVANWEYRPSDECFVDGLGYINRYPYGMDFYTWNEPTYHWINFKRNGPNHWHSDTPHVHLDYRPAEVESGTPYPLNQNEENLIPGRGYMAAIMSETLLQSHGRLNSGDTSIMLTKDGIMLQGWNLVGNPYHGYLDFDKLATTNTDLLDEVPGENGDPVPFYVVYDADSTRRDRTPGFIYYPQNGSAGGAYAGRFLHPHQGFYVKTKKADKLKFKESMLATRAEVTGAGWGINFRDERPAYPLVNLYLSSDHGCNDVTVIEFNRPETGGARKLKELRVGNGLFYAHFADDYYAALFAPEGIDRVPLWFEAKEDDIFTITWDKANGDFHSMWLIDNIAGVQYDMLRNDTYSFEGHVRDYPSRFLIVFDITGLEDSFDIDKPFAFHDGDEWVVTGDGTLQFVDVLGHILKQESVHGQTRMALPTVANGVYMFRLMNDKGVKMQKVIISNYGGGVQ
jgi:hypothetical protein